MYLLATWLSQLIGDILDPFPDGPPSETMGILDELHQAMADLDESAQTGEPYGDPNQSWSLV